MHSETWRRVGRPPLRAIHVRAVRTLSSERLQRVASPSRWQVPPGVEEKVMSDEQKLYD